MAGSNKKNAPKRPEFNSTVCYECGSRCCHYVIRRLPDPEDRIDIEELRWFVCHRNVLVYIDDDEWNLVFETPCENLDYQGRCRIYHKRPDTCRDYSVKSCEYVKPGGFGDVAFRTLEELDEYLKDAYPKWWKETRAKRKKEATS